MFIMQQLNMFILYPCAAAPVLSGLLHRQWKRPKTVELQPEPCSLRLIDCQLWQCHGGGISMFTLDLEPVRQISAGYMYRIRDVANTGLEEVVVAAENGLYSLNKDGSSTYRMAQLYAVHHSSNTLHIYKRSGSTWTQHSSFSVEH